MLYVADSRITAFWEIFWDELGTRAPGDRRIDGRKLMQRRVSRLEVEARRIFDATDPNTLNAASAPSAAFSGDYAKCQEWALALFEHPQKPDGILYESARTKGARCMALFDEREVAVSCPREGVPLFESRELLGALYDAGITVLL